MTIIPRLSHSKTVFDNVDTASGSLQRLFPKQTPVDLMCAVLRKLSESEAMVFDPCMGTGFVAKVCLLECNHRIFIGCKPDSHCAAVMMPSVPCVFAEQFLNSDSDIEKGICWLNHRGAVHRSGKGF